MFPDSAAAKGKRDGEGELSAEQMAFAQLTQGIHCQVSGEAFDRTDCCGDRRAPITGTGTEPARADVPGVR